MSCAFPHVVTLPLDPTEFRELIVPLNANYYLLKTVEGTAITFRNDATDPNTEDVFVAESMFAPHHEMSFGSYRMRAGDSLGFYRGTGTLKAKFWA